ncbi:uncharacterized protein LOC115632382 [Scaptodrosophila lebanonensis]|uniref:lysozyme n=1 Tax=Drosophila lebanonensis TaxID=7225 RepID=A0A6J2UA25_DROLE|nr:uncharacterized protein LOC115632382 [Scaptodrosophila lebanonensis]
MLPLLLLLLLLQLSFSAGKVFDRCELSQLLQRQFGMPASQAATLVCIAQHSSSLNTATFGGGSGPGGGSHGLFQISDVYWCSPPGQGAGCGVSCARLRDDDISDDVQCVRKIFAEHQRISGDGFTAWQAYEQYCRHDAASYVAGCGGLGAGFSAGSALIAAASHQPVSYQPVSYQPASYQPVSYQPVRNSGAQVQSKIYNRCELAQELYYNHKMPMQQIPTWVCIAQHESSFNTAAVGRLNTDGSADHGLFQISDLFWCTHDARGGKGCRISCDKLLDKNIADDVQCIKRIHQEHTQISGDGFTAWTVYNRNCRNQRYEQVAACFAKPQAAAPHHPNAIGGGAVVSKTSYVQPQKTTLSSGYYRPTTVVSSQLPSSYLSNPFLRPHISAQAQPHPNAINVPQKAQSHFSLANPFQKYKQQTPFYTNTYTTPQQQPQHLYNHYQRPTPSRSGHSYVGVHRRA